MTVSRRMVLAGGVGGTLVLAGAGLTLWPSKLVVDPPTLKSLTATQYAVLVAVANRMCPGDDSCPSAAEIGVAAKIDAQLATMHPADAAEFGQGLMLLENAFVGLLLDGRMRPFTRLPAAQQDDVLNAFRTSKITLRRSVYKALRGLISASYWADPRLYATLGYPGPPDYRRLMEQRATMETTSRDKLGSP